MEFFSDYENKLKIFRTHPLFKKYIKGYEKIYNDKKGEPLPIIGYDEYMLYFHSGDRIKYEKKYFFVRKKKNAAVIINLYYQKEEYLNELCNIIWAICSEPTWCLPAHAALEETEPALCRQIDLFSSETGMYLSEIYYLFNKELPVQIKKLIKNFVEQRIFDSYENGKFWWESVTNNWAAVCAGSVGMAYMYLSPERFETVKPRILKTINCFLSGFEADGCCTEGISYWFYGFGFFTYFADMLYRYSDGKDDIRHSKKIDNIALFAQKIKLRNNGICVSFADGSQYSLPSSFGLLCYYANNYNGFKMPKITLSCDGEQCKLVEAVRNVLWTDTNLVCNNTFIDYNYDYFSNACWYINRKEKFSFAAKGGHNDEHHNHNDVGSFIIATDKGQILADMGAMIYNKDTFSDKRYELIHNSSLGHSLPVIDGKAQKFGRQYCGKVLKVSENVFSLEIGKAYGLESDDIVRTFEIGENYVILKDAFNTPAEITERFITPYKPEIKDNIVFLPDVTLKGLDEIHISQETLIDHKGLDKIYYFIDSVINKSSCEVKIEIV